MDFHAKLSMGWGMINLDEIEPIKVRSALFALITARLEDAHELAVRGQRTKMDRSEVLKLLEGIVDQTNQIEILLMAIGALEE